MIGQYSCPSSSCLTACSPAACMLLNVRIRMRLGSPTHPCVTSLVTWQPSGFRSIARVVRQNTTDKMNCRRGFVLLLLSVLVLSHPALSDIPEHLVKSLPGWDGPLPTTQYSGYIQIDATTGKNLHYWWVSDLQLQISLSAAEFLHNLECPDSSCKCDCMQNWMQSWRLQSSHFCSRLLSPSNQYCISRPLSKLFIPYRPPLTISPENRWNTY